MENLNVEGTETSTTSAEPTLTLEVVKNFLEKNDDGRKYLNQYTDAKITKAIKTFEDKSLPALVDEKVKQLYPDISPEQKQLGEMKLELERIRNEAAREKLLNKALKIASEKGLPTEIVERFIGVDEESTESNLLSLEAIFNNAIKSAVEGKLPGLGRSPEQDKKTGKPDISKMSKNEFAEYTKNLKIGL